MLRLGAHESIAGDLCQAFERAEAVGCESLQIWTRNGRQWESPPLDDLTVRRFMAARDSRSISPVVAHASYLINIASSDPALHLRSVTALTDELNRCRLLEIPYLVLHPGAHTGAGIEAGIEQAARALRQTLAFLGDAPVRILLETMAGQGTTLGGSFEDLAQLLDRVDDRNHLGVCFDTCHVFGAGYEIRTSEGYAGTMEAFDNTIGLNRLYVVHLNDSKCDLGSRKDRHAHIGEGHIGQAGFAPILTDPRLAGLAGIIETPKSGDLHEDRQNLVRLREATGLESLKGHELPPNTVGTTDDTVGA